MAPGPVVVISDHSLYMEARSYRALSALANGRKTNCHKEKIIKSNTQTRTSPARRAGKCKNEMKWESASAILHLEEDNGLLEDYPDTDCWE